MVGLVTLHNVKAVHRELWAAKTVGEVMTPFEKLKWVHPNDDPSDVLHLLADEDVNQMPVVDDTGLIGMVTREGLLRLLQMRAELGI